MKNASSLGPLVLRIGMAFVFLYFGFQQIASPADWTGYIPSFLTGTVLTAANWVIMNGILELTLGTFLLVGIYTRISALVLSAHLFGITTTIGFTPLGVRDFGLAVATLVIFFLGAPSWSIDARAQKKSTAEFSDKDGKEKR